ncbi:hypothetical protein SESBI_14089 [Sesbania bispinosa]|nr:hypothetical protein SESBI_14089 [Sesbania bispinosa]
MELCTAILPSRCSVPPRLTFSTSTPHPHGGFPRLHFLPIKTSLPFSRFNFNSCTKAKGLGGRLRPCVAVNEGSSCDVLDDSRMIRVCDKLIGVFMVDKPTPTDWRRLLAFSKEWDNIRPHFFTRCHDRALAETDPTMKEKLLRLARKLKEIDEDVQRHNDLLEVIKREQSEISEIVAKRRKDFTKEFFVHLHTVAESYYDNAEKQNELAKLGNTCLAAVQAYDAATENIEQLQAAELKFQDIINSPSLDAACRKIDNLAEKKELDSTLVLMITKAWSAAKESNMMKDESRFELLGSDTDIVAPHYSSWISSVPLLFFLSRHCLYATSKLHPCECLSFFLARNTNGFLVLRPSAIIESCVVDWSCKVVVKDILYHLYKSAVGNLQRLVPKEIRIIKYIIRIEDPEEQLSALKDAFTPGEELEGKDVDNLYTTPEKLHLWIKTVVDAYHLSKEGTLIREARDLMNPEIIQKLEILKNVVERNFM